MLQVESRSQTERTRFIESNRKGDIIMTATKSSPSSFVVTQATAIPAPGMLKSKGWYRVDPCCHPYRHLFFTAKS